MLQKTRFLQQTKYKRPNKIEDNTALKPNTFQPVSFSLSFHHTNGEYTAEMKIGLVSIQQNYIVV